jgi:RimJ/RimL family protein N-acetyltransferase
MTTGTITTARLCLRTWRDEDLPTFAALNADHQVMEHFPGTLSRAESDAMVARNRGHFAKYSFGM